MSNSSNKSRTINISLPAKLVQEMDKAAISNYSSRSDFIRESIVRRLRHEESGWETVVDFREIGPKGVSAREVLKALQKLTRT